MPDDPETPTPPDLSNRGTPTDFEAVETAGNAVDFQREELETALADGAWRDGFAEWWEYTDLGADEVATLDAMGVFQSFDFYWDPQDERLRYVTPAVPAVESDDPAPEGFGSSSDISRIEDELRDLGRAVMETLEEVYAPPGQAEGGGAYGWTDESLEGQDRFEE